MTATDRRQELRDLAQESMNRYHVPGVAVGIVSDGEEIVETFGITSVENPTHVTPHTLFQIGSITKTVTGILAMRLVEKGKLDLDVPVRSYMPELRLSDEDTASRITMRHLLNHTSGILGDYFDDPSRGDDALERMAEIVATLPQITPLGEFWSYCNSGFYLAGRIIELITGTIYEDAATEMVLKPLGMTESFFFPEDVMTYSFAVGHNVEAESASVARPWHLARSAHAAGGITASILDNLTYARFWLGDGTTPDGARVLTPQSMQAMMTPGVPASNGQWVGISWFMDDAEGGRIVQHGGGTNGQVAAFQLVPEKRFAVAVLTNADESAVLRDITAWALERFAGVRRVQPARMELSDEQLREYKGSYEAAASILDLEPDNGSMRATLTPKGGFPFPDSPPQPGPPPFHIELLEGERVMGVEDEFRAPLGEFIRDADGHITWLRFGGRMHRKQ